MSYKTLSSLYCAVNRHHLTPELRLRLLDPASTLYRDETNTDHGYYTELMSKLFALSYDYAIGNSCLCRVIPATIQEVPVTKSFAAKVFYHSIFSLFILGKSGKEMTTKRRRSRSGPSTGRGDRPWPGTSSTTRRLSEAVGCSTSDPGKLHSLCFMRDSLHGTVGEILEKIRDKA